MKPDGPLYHGGVRGFHTGRLLLPPSVTHARSLADYGAEGICRRDRVYMTTDIDQAHLYALMAQRGGGAVYEVEPLGELEIDPDYLGDDAASWCAPEAKILRVVTRRVAALRPSRASPGSKPRGSS